MFDSITVIYNPAAGRGKAARTLARWHQRLPGRVTFLASERPGHGIELARKACDSGATFVIAAGGDGTVHEVARGILASSRPEVIFAPLPLGSMNDYAFALGLQEWWRKRQPWEYLQTKRVDVGLIRGGGREAHFVNCCGIGFNGMVTIEARKIRRLRGIPLYALAVLQGLRRHFIAPPMNIQLDDKTITLPTLAMTIGLGPREGGFPLTKDAILDDGLFDTLHVSDVGRFELIRHLPGMITGNLPRDHAKLRFDRVRTVSVTSETPLCVHIDGEFFCLPDDRVKSIEVEVVERALTVATVPTV
ncbi:diacylglycerol kinase family lipid kinase [soil metagenome]